MTFVMTMRNAMLSYDNYDKLNTPTSNSLIFFLVNYDTYINKEIQ